MADVAWLGAETVVSGDDAGDVSLWPCAALSAAAPASADAEALDAALEPTARVGGHTGAVPCVRATESPRDMTRDMTRLDRRRSSRATPIRSCGCASRP